MNIIIGNNAKIFAEGQRCSFLLVQRKDIKPSHYALLFCQFASTFMLATIGAFVTIKVIKPRLEKRKLYNYRRYELK